MPREYSLENTRNFGIIAHIDAGKTTVQETRSSASLKFVLAVGLLVFLGAGCAKTVEPVVNIQPAAQESDAVKKMRSDISNLQANWSYDQWSIIGVDKVCSLDNAKIIFPNNDWQGIGKVLDQYQKDGWKLAKFCAFSEAPMAYVLMREETDPKTSAGYYAMEVGTIRSSDKIESTISKPMKLVNVNPPEVDDINAPARLQKKQDYQIMVGRDDINGNWLEQYVYNSDNQQLKFITKLDRQPY